MTVAAFPVHDNNRQSYDYQPRLNSFFSSSSFDPRRLLVRIELDSHSRNSVVLGFLKYSPSLWVGGPGICLIFVIFSLTNFPWYVGRTGSFLQNKKDVPYILTFKVTSSSTRSWYGVNRTTFDLSLVNRLRIELPAVYHHSSCRDAVSWKAVDGIAQFSESHQSMPL